MQGMQVQFLAGELRSHMLGATKPMCYNYWACVQSETCAPQQKIPENAVKFPHAATTTWSNQINEYNFFKDKLKIGRTEGPDTVQPANLGELRIKPPNKRQWQNSHILS